MKLKIALFLMLLCLGSGVFVGCSQQVDPEPRMQIESDAVDTVDGNGEIIEDD